MFGRYPATAGLPVEADRPEGAYLIRPSMTLDVLYVESGVGLKLIRFHLPICDLPEARLIVEQYYGP